MNRVSFLPEGSDGPLAVYVWVLKSAGKLECYTVAKQVRFLVLGSMQHSPAPSPGLKVEEGNQSKH